MESCEKSIYWVYNFEKMHKFIVVEWVDGSGKWTQVELLKRYLELKGFSVGILDFPRYEEESSYFVKKYLNGSYGTIEEVWPKVASLFYALDRFDAKKSIEHLISEKDFVISNRYVSANLVHQSSKLSSTDVDEYLLWASELEYGILWLPKPDITLFLNIDSTTSSKLISTKAERAYIKDGSNKDLHEWDPNHLSRAVNIGRRISQTLDGWKTIECEENGEILPREIITKKILDAIGIDL